MKRIAAFLALAFALSICGAFAHAAPLYSPQWDYGSGNYRWDRSWNNRPDPRDGACFYSDAGFRGNRFCVRAGDQIPHLPSGYGDNISSIQIFGRAGVRLFNDRNYRNGGVELDRSVADLRNVPFRDGHTWNNRISSIIVGGGGFGRGQRAPGYNQPRQNDYWNYGSGNNRWDRSWNSRPDPRDGACFYSSAPFRGNHFCVRSGDRIPQLPSNFGDNISSVQTFGRARVRIFNDRNFRGGGQVLNGSVPDLRDVPFRGGHTWNNRISSIIVY